MGVKTGEYYENGFTYRRFHQYIQWIQSGRIFCFYDYHLQQKNGLSSIYDTWWAKVNQTFYAYICVTNSDSVETGSLVSFLLDLCMIY